MTSRSGKRQKRHSSDEEEDNGAYLPAKKSAVTEYSASCGLKKRLRSGSLTSLSQARSETTNMTDSCANESILASSSVLSPVKKKQGKRSKAKSGSLYSFFNSTTLNQKRHANGDARTDAELGKTCIDIIEDDVSDDDHHQGYTSQCRKELSSRLPSVSGSQIHMEATSKGTTRHDSTLKHTRNRSPYGLDSGEKDCRPWAEKYAPIDLEELGVHKKKVCDVRSWLSNVLTGRDRKRLLILRGPPGSGKTATVQVLKKSLGFETVEWRNPVGTSYTSDHYLSISAQFEEFLVRGGKYDSLPLRSDGAKPTESPTKALLSTQTSNMKVILLEEFPSILSCSTVGHSRFRSSVLQYLAANVPLSGVSAGGSRDACTNITPIIMLISETPTTSATTVSDSFSAHRLLGPEILNHPGVKTLDFNPIAPTILIKALNLVMQKEARESGRHRIPGPAVLKQLSEVGDIRNAIASLEFMCAKGINSSNDDWGGTVAWNKKSTTSKTSAAMTKLEKESVNIVTKRATTLDLFHAVGKVVHNKRDDTPNQGALPSGPPGHDLSGLSRSMVSAVNVDQLIDETGSDVQTFVAALHENYVPSCSGDGFLSSLNDCIDALSDSDIIGPDASAGGGSGRMGAVGNSQSSSGTDAIRKNEIYFNLAVRGLLFGLPNPVNRQAAAHVPGRGKQLDCFKMFYPSSMRLWKLAEDINSLVDSWMGTPKHLLMPTGGPNIASTRTASRVSAWQHGTGEGMLSTLDIRGSIMLGTKAARAEMIMEQLPYIAKIEQQRVRNHSYLSQLQNVTQFSEHDGRSDDVPDEDDGVLSSHYVPNNTWRAPLRSVKSSQAMVIQRGFATPGEIDMEKLVLSDDDIEDG